MTRKRSFKHRVRARMKKTGERYTAARAQILKSSRPSCSTLPGLFDGYTSFGGVHGDTGALANLLRHAAVTSPTGEPFSEAFVNGICGGVGFLYAVFEYRGFPPLLSILLRHNTMPDGFILGGLEKLPVDFSVEETSGAKTARKTLEQSLSSCRAALCVADMAELPYYGMPSTMSGMCPVVIGVAGCAGGDLLVDDRSVEPRRVSIDQLMKARGSYRKAKHRWISVRAAERDYDLAAAIRAALQATVHGYSEAPMKSFASNYGFRGLKKWQGLLTNPKEKKAWAKLFPEGNRAYAGLRRLYDSIEYEYTAPGAGRSFYAEFIDEVARIDEFAELSEVAGIFRQSGARWSAIAEQIAGCADPAVQQGCALSDQRAELMDSSGDSAALADLWSERFTSGHECSLSHDAARAIYVEIAELVGEIIELEQDAIEKMRRFSG